MALKVNPKQFIKLYRRFMEWEWYGDVNTKALFIHCLLRANWKAGVWQGIHYDAGEFITSLAKLSEETGLSVRSIRTSLNRLNSTGEVTSRTTDKVTGKKLPKCRIITVKNWSKYQADDKEDDKQNDKQADKEATSSRQASDNRYRSNRSIEDIEKDIKPSSPSENGDDDLFEGTFEEWVEKQEREKNGTV